MGSNMPAVPQAALGNWHQVVCVGMVAIVNRRVPTLHYRIQFPTLPAIACTSMGTSAGSMCGHEWPP
jgi:hypothetical protein